MSDAPVAEPVVIEMTDHAVIARVHLKLFDDKSLKRMDELIDKAACGRPGVNDIVLDLSRVQIVPSLGLGAILQLHNKYKERHQHVMLAGVQPQVRTTLAITKLDRILDLRDSVEKALH